MPPVETNIDYVDTPDGSCSSPGNAPVLHLTRELSDGAGLDCHKAHIVSPTNPNVSTLDEERENENDEISTKSVSGKKKESMVLIESQKQVRGLVFHIYFIENSRDSKRFLISKKTLKLAEDEGSAYRPLEFECMTLKEAHDWISRQTSSHEQKTQESNVIQNEHKKKRSREPSGKDFDRVRQTTKEGNIFSWNTTKGYGFIREDETSKNIFFHTSRIGHSNWEPAKGDRVEYKLDFDEKKMRDTATEVKLVDLDSRHSQDTRRGSAIYSHDSSAKTHVRRNFPVSTPASRHFQNHPYDQHADEYPTHNQGYYEDHYLGQMKRNRSSHNKFSDAICRPDHNCT